MGRGVDVLGGDQGDCRDGTHRAVLYASDREGNDAAGDGTKEKPFKTCLKVLMAVGKEPFPTIYVGFTKGK